MKSSQERGARQRWGEALLGGLAGLGVPVLLLGRRRGRGAPANQVAVGVLAGLLGALVGGRLARRPGRPVPGGAGGVFSKEERRLEPVPHEKDAPEPRRGPSGRERYWRLQASASGI